MTPESTAEQTNSITGGYLQLLTKLSISLVSSSRQYAPGAGFQLYCQKLIQAQEWENIVFRFAIGKQNKWAMFSEGCRPPPPCLFIFTATGWSRVSAEPPLAHPALSCPAPASSQPRSAGGCPRNFPGRTRKRDSGGPCMWVSLWPKSRIMPLLSLLKWPFPDLPGFKQETVVPTCRVFQWRMKEAFSSHCRCNPCSSKGCPVHCSSQPCPAWVSPGPLPQAALTSQGKICPPWAGKPGFAPFWHWFHCIFSPVPSQVWRRAGHVPKLQAETKHAPASKPTLQRKLAMGLIMELINRLKWEVTLEFGCPRAPWDEHSVPPGEGLMPSPGWVVPFHTAWPWATARTQALWRSAALGYSWAATTWPGLHFPMGCLKVPYYGQGL